MSVTSKFISRPERAWLTLREISQMTAKPFLVAKLFVSGSFNLLISPRKVGKTIVATDLALSIATGQAAWQGQNIAPAARGGLVIYVLGEGVGRFKLRLRAWCAAHGMNPLRLWNKRSFILHRRSINLLDDVAVVTFINDTIPAMCRRANVEQPTLIVFDTWARCVATSDEESYNHAVLNIDRLRDATSATILALHHVPKSGKKTARGSGALEGAIDAMFELDAVNQQTFRLEASFHRDLDADACHRHTFERVTYQFDDIVDSDTGEPESSVAMRKLSDDESRTVEHDALEKAVLDCVRSHGLISGSRVAELVKRNKAAVGKAVDALITSGYLVPTGAGPTRKVSVPAIGSQAVVPEPVGNSRKPSKTSMTSRLSA